MVRAYAASGASFRLVFCWGGLSISGVLMLIGAVGARLTERRLREQG
jgi:hypothetical protein